MPNIIIHRGSKTIGGSCIEVKSGSSRIIFDLGMPLMEDDGSEIDEKKAEAPSIENGILPNVEGLYYFQEPSIDAVFISHAHIDHYGLLNFLYPSIPVFLSQGTNALTEIGNIFYPHETKIQNKKIFEHWKQLSVGPFKITPYLMDHSGPDASAFLIKADNKKVFYTGDFRGHGRKAKVLDNLSKYGISDLDCLLMEGTTLGGKHNVGFATEEDVENEMEKLFSNQKDVSFVMSAGSNVDRTVSIYKAAKSAEKVLVVDLYTYHLLKELKKLWPSLPPHQNDNIRVLNIKFHGDRLVKKFGRSILEKYYDRRIGEEEIVQDREKMVLRLPVSRMARLAKMMAQERPLRDINFIFSMWQGYLERDPSFKKFCASHNLTIKNVHTSGHAYLKDLKRLADALKPKTLIPVHTLHGDDFSEHFQNVLRLEDGKAFEVQ